MFTVNDLINLKSFAGAEVIGGREYLAKEIQGLCVMEVPDIKDYAKPKDFLLTTLYPLVKSENSMTDFMADLSKVGFSGIGIKLNRYVYNIPPILVEQAEKYKLPLIILPEDSNFSLQMKDFLIETNYRKTLELEYRDMLHNQVMNVISERGDYNALCNYTARMVEKDMAFFDDAGNLIAAALMYNGTTLEDCKEFSRSILSSEEVKKGYLKNPLCDKNYYSYEVVSGVDIIGYMVIFLTKTKLKEYDIIAVEQFALAYQIFFHKEKEIKQIEQRYIEEFVHDLLAGRLKSEAEMKNRALALKWKISFPFYIMLIDAEVKQSLSKKELEQRMGRYMRSHIPYMPQSDWGYFIVYDGTYIVIFIDSTVDSYCEKIGECLINFFSFSHVKKYHIGISKEVQILQNVEKAYWQAEKALSIVKILKRDSIMYFRDTGVYRLLLSMEDQEELKDFCEEEIGLICKYDEEHGTDLLNTLRLFIENNCNIKKTSQQMFVHYNTVRYRCMLIEELLGRSLDSPQILQDISLALKIRDVL